jgi:hypothetical protein
MSILAAVSIKSLHLLGIPVRLWPRLKIGRSILGAAQGYADAVSIPYLITFGLEPHTSATREQVRHSFDD